MDGSRQSSRHAEYLNIARDRDFLFKQEKIQNKIKCAFYISLFSRFFIHRPSLFLSLSCSLAAASVCFISRRLRLRCALFSAVRVFPLSAASPDFSFAFDSFGIAHARSHHLLLRHTQERERQSASERSCARVCVSLLIHSKQ